MIYLPEHATVAFRGIGVKATANKNASTNIDFVMTEDCLLKGGNLFAHNTAFGDKIDAYVGVFDPQGNFIELTQWLEDWFIPPPTADGIVSPIDIETEILGQLYNGLVLRIVYHSIGLLVDPEIACNIKRYVRL